MKEASAPQRAPAYHPVAVISLVVYTGCAIVVATGRLAGMTDQLATVLCLVAMLAALISATFHYVNLPPYGTHESLALVCRIVTIKTLGMIAAITSAVVGIYGITELGYTYPLSELTYYSIQLLAAGLFTYVCGMEKAPPRTRKDVHRNITPNS